MDKKLKILVVDDVEFFRDVMCDYLKRTPAEVLTASSGAEALERAEKESPDLVYLDADMPGMSGMECCRRFKEHSQLGKIPVVLVFTPERDATPEEIESSGCDGCLRKPFGKEEFLNVGHGFLFDLERREPRVSCQTTVDFEVSGRTFQGRAFDLSRQGMYVEFRDELPPGREVRVRFLLPTISARRIETQGRITWVNQGFPRNNLKLPQGFGVQFNSLPEACAEVVATYLERY